MSTAVMGSQYGFSGARGGAVRPSAVRPATAVRPAATAAPAVGRLRLTKRGRAVLTFLAATPLVIGALLFAINGGGATASLEGSSAGFQYVTVESGQTLWQLAEQVAPAADPRDVISEIMQLNQLPSADVVAGQELAIPAAYAK